MSTISEKTKVIGGITYTTTTWDAITLMELAPTVGVLLGEQTFSVMMGLPFDGATEEGVSDMGQQPSVMATVAATILANAAKVEGGLVPACKALLKNVRCSEYRLGDTKVEGGPVWLHINEHFAGKIGELIQVIWWVLAANFFDTSAESP